MDRRRAALPLVLAVLLAPAPLRAEVAVRVGDATATLAEIDARTGGKAEQLLARLHEVADDALTTLVDARLRATADPSELAPAPPAPVTDAEIDAFRRERARDFEGPDAPGGSLQDAAVQRAAIRHYLEREARERARERALETLRARHAIERRLPDAAALARPLPPRQVVARVDGAPIRADALEAHAALRLYRLRGELARERRRRAEAWVEERLLAQEAARRGLLVDAMIDQETQAPRDADVRAYVAAEVAAGRPAPDPARARPYLAFRARHAARERLLAAARARTTVDVAIEAPAPPRLPMETADAPALGPADGPRLMVFTNHRCRICRTMHGEIDRLLESGAGVRVVFRDFIPQYDPGAREAAAAARCADRMGRFAAMRRALHAAERPDFGRSWDLDALARAASLEPAALRECMGRDDVQDAIDADTRAARRLGFDAAPAFVAEGVPLSGAQSAAGLARAVREGLGSSARTP